MIMQINPNKAHVDAGKKDKRRTTVKKYRQEKARF